MPDDTPLVVDSIVGQQVVVASHVGQVSIGGPVSMDSALRGQVARVVQGSASLEDWRGVEAALIASGGELPPGVHQTSVQIHSAATVSIGESASPEGIAAALQRLQARIDADAMKKSLQAYASGLRVHAESLPYTLPGGQRGRMSELFVALSARVELSASEEKDSETLRATDAVAKAMSNADGRLVLVTGKAGAGKSTLLRWLALEAWNAPEKLGFAQRQIPIIVNLRRLAAAEGVEVGERLWNALRLTKEMVVDVPPPAGYYSRWRSLIDASWLLLLDGLDEVPPAARDDVLEWVRKLSEQDASATFVVTSRSSTLLEGTPFSTAPVIVLEPLTSDELAEIGQRRLKSDPAGLLAAIERTCPPGLVDTPLVASIAAALFVETGQLPSTRAGLYEQLLTISMREARRQGLDEPLRPEVADGVDAFLERFALYTIEAPDAESPSAIREFACGFVRECMPQTGTSVVDRQAQSLLRAISERSGVLRVDGTVEWGHLSFRDFLAARWLARAHDPNSSSGLEIVRRWRRDQWRSVIVFLVGVWADASDRAGLDPVFKTIFENRVEAPSLLGRLKAWSHRLVDRTPDDATVDIDCLVTTAQVLAQAGGASEAFERRFEARLCANPDNLWSGGRCARLFRPRNELDALLELRLCTGILERWQLLISQAEAAVRRGVDPAVSLLVELGLGSRLTIFLSDPDVPAPPLFAGLASAHASNPKQVRELFDALTRARIYEGASLDAQRRGVIAGFAELADLLKRVRADLAELAPNGAAGVKLARSRTAPAFLRLVGLGKAIQEGLPHTTETLVELHNANIGLAAPELVLAVLKEGGQINNAIDFAITSLDPAALGWAERDPKVPESFRRFITLANDRPLKDRDFASVALHELEGLVEAVDLEAKLATSFAECAAQILTADALFRYILDSACPSVAATACMEEMAKRGLLNQRRLDEPSLTPQRRLDLANAFLKHGGDAVIGNTARLSALDALLRNTPDDPVLLRARAATLYDLDRVEDAEQAFNVAIEKQSHAGAFEGRARARYVRNDDEGALSDVQAAIDCGARDGYAQFLRGLIWSRQGKHRPAIAAFNEAVELGWMSRTLLQTRAECFLALGFLDEAEADCNAALVIDEKNKEVLAIRGAVRIGLRRYAEAEPDLKAAIESHTNGDWPRGNLGWCRAFQTASDAPLLLETLAQESPNDQWPIVLAALLRRRGVDVAGLPPTQFSLNDDPENVIAGAILAALQDDAITASRLANAIVEAGDEARLRWLRIHLHNFHKQVPLASLAALLPVATDGLARLRVGAIARATPRDATAQDEQATGRQPKDMAREPKLSDFPEDPPEEVRNRLPMPQGMLCRLRAIQGFGREKKFAEAMLQHSAIPEAAIVWLLEDGEHLYLQANRKWEEEDEHCFKMVAPLQPLLDQRIFSDQIIRGKQLKAVFFRDDVCLRRVSSHPSMRSLVDRFTLLPRSTT